MMVVFMDLVSGYVVLEEVADDRTYETWYERVTARLEPMKTYVLYLVSDRAKALIKLAETGLECPSIPDVFHLLHELAKYHSINYCRILSCFLLARIIHQPKNRSENGFLKPSEASKQPYPRLVTLPRPGYQIILTLHQAVSWARSDALASSQPSGAASSAWPLSRLGSRSRSQDLLDQTHAG
jgi:hypothetical protein